MSHRAVFWNHDAMHFTVAGYAEDLIRADLARGYSIVGEHPSWALRAMGARLSRTRFA